MRRSVGPFFPSGLEQSIKMPVSGSASTGGSSGRGDTAGPPEKSFDNEVALDVGVRVYANLID